MATDEPIAMASLKLWAVLISYIHENDPEEAKQILLKVRDEAQSSKDPLIKAVLATIADISLSKSPSDLSGTSGGLDLSSSSDKD